MATMKSNRVRYQLFLPEELSHRFEALAAAPGASKSAILTDALTAWLNRQAASELANRFHQRLDRMSMALGRIERDGHILLESLALFVRYELMVQADRKSVVWGKSGSVRVDRGCRRIMKKNKNNKN